MEYNQFGEYELDENIEIEDFGDVEEFFEDPAIQFMKTKQEPEYQQSSQRDQEMRIFFEGKNSPKFIWLSLQGIAAALQQ